MTSKNKDNLLKQAFVTRTHGFLDISLKRDLFNELSISFNGEFAMNTLLTTYLKHLIFQFPIKIG